MNWLNFSRPATSRMLIGMLKLLPQTPALLRRDYSSNGGMNCGNPQPTALFVTIVLFIP